MKATNEIRVSNWPMEYVVRPCAIAGFFVLVAFLWTLFLQHVIAYPFVFLFFGAVMGSAWFGGFIAGFVAVLMSSVVIDYFFVPPFFSIAVAKESQSFFAAFILCSIAVTVVSSSRKRVENAIRIARDQLETKVQERTVELQQSNREIRDSERQLRMLTEAIPQQIWRTDVAGSIEYCNRHLCDYLGQRTEVLRGEAFFNVIHPEDKPLFREGWQQALTSGDRFEIEARVRGGNGVYRWFLVRSIPQHSEEGQIARWYGIHIDIEQQHRAQQNFVQAQDDLTRLLRSLSMAEMAASIAHELNQPLTAVVTHAYACREWLRSKPANLEKASATAEKIVQESTRASVVVSRVRALFRKEAQVRELTSMNRLIQEIARLMRDEAIRRDVSIRLELANDLPQLEMDPVQIQQVILNLAMNGMDAMMQVARPRELIVCTENYGDGGILVAVKDHGSGIASEIATRMFEPFFSTKPQGTGMGLAICRSIIEAHDGQLWAENSVRGGAVLQFTLRAQS
ncbi:MAG TPA: ATP-binding protein [Terracidiphilus sp.]|jgi:PAS domain S-box-containing protein|nr:ATP-binding protein [Terracidiphilus sp.]